MSKRILVVDDDAMNLRMAEFILKKEGYDVCKVESGMECLLFLRDDSVDLILLDIEMPIMSGLKTFEIIRENEEMQNIPVIFLTASADSDNVMEAIKLGAAGYVTKPFLPEELLKRVSTILS